MHCHLPFCGGRLRAACLRRGGSPMMAMVYPLAFVMAGKGNLLIWKTRPYLPANIYTSNLIYEI